MSFQPLIGITCELTCHPQHAVQNENTLRRTYTEAVLAAGALPVIIPVIDDREQVERIVARLDGLVFSGGADIPPERYGQAPHPAVRVMPPEQFRGWSSVMESGLAAGKPILAICAGVQLLNVTLGGSLIQDIPSQSKTSVVHGGPTPPDAMHEVELEQGSRVADIVGRRRLTTNSSHHQALDRIADRLRVTARCVEDGIVEAAEVDDHPFCIGVQWHPERMPDDEATRRLFAALVETSKRRNVETSK